MKLTREFYEKSYPFTNIPFSLSWLRTILICCTWTYKEIQFTRINNDIIKRDVIWCADHVLQIMTMTIIEDISWMSWKFTRYDSDYYWYSWYYVKFNDNITYHLELCRIYKYDTRTCKITILPLNMKITILSLDATFSV